MSEMPETEVKVGQVWKDWSIRVRNQDPGRRVRVESLDDTHAECVNVETGKRTKIKLDRFRPFLKGYKLVEDVPLSPEVPVKKIAVLAPAVSKEPLSVRVAERRIRMARQEVERLERVVQLRKDRHRSTESIRKREARLGEARKRLEALQAKKGL